MNVYRNDGVSLPQLCERGETPYAGVSRRKDEEGCGTRDVDTVVNVGVRRGFVASLKLCRTRGSRFSSSRSVVLQRHCAHRILLVELCERDSENIGEKVDG